MYFYAARQPILDAEKSLYGYELLFRDSLVNVFPDIDEDEATSRMIEGSQFTLGIDDFTGSKPAFINFTLDTILKKYPFMLSHEHLVVEILETVQPGKRLLEEVKELKESGYMLALDDYEHKSVWKHFFPYIDIIKIDVQVSTREDIEFLKKEIEPFPQIKLLAEKVETNEQFQEAVELGFTYFQGFFFSKPEVVKSKALSPAQMTLAELLYETSKTEPDLPSITKIFERDVNLSYKLLRYSNSSIFRRRAEISTIKQALIVLGQKELKRFLSVLFTAQVSTDKPAELMRLSMTRAKFSEGLSELMAPNEDSSKAFLTGLLSLIDAILDESIENIMERLPLADDIKDALVKGEGKLAELIELIIVYEKAEWDAANTLIEKLSLDKEKVPDVYHDAAQWANQQMQALGEE
ncbi:EAL and HDOD domain-containing protein [Algicola sagamiensis]|uniref:EAL and HDOD domain-containing protein n=1 Tax=Algicola sagamiensis TaxID=163869 RepID=UPI0003778412|nr:HDOD domain-containing protein [Algicola sagamiensis]